LFSGTTLHPIHLSIGVSRSEVILDGGAENAFFTPSKRPYKAVDEETAFCGPTENPDTDDVSRISEARVFILKLASCCCIEKVLETAELNARGLRLPMNKTDKQTISNCCNLPTQRIKK
jgi:hypothetical protein